MLVFLAGFEAVGVGDRHAPVLLARVEAVFVAAGERDARDGGQGQCDEAAFHDRFLSFGLDEYSALTIASAGIGRIAPPDGGVTSATGVAPPCAAASGRS